jgi:hypothetical protein
MTEQTLLYFRKCDQQETAFKRKLLLTAIFSKSASEAGVNFLLFVPEKYKEISYLKHRKERKDYFHLLPRL